MTYCENQRKKMLEKKDGRPAKYAAAYVRVLFNLCELLERGTFSIRIAETPVGDAVRKIKDGEYGVGEVMRLGVFGPNKPLAGSALAHSQARRSGRCVPHQPSQGLSALADRNLQSS